jgi:hypothetical protein
MFKFRKIYMLGLYHRYTNCLYDNIFWENKYILDCVYWKVEFTLDKYEPMFTWQLSM